MTPHVLTRKMGRDSSRSRFLIVIIFCISFLLFYYNSEKNNEDQFTVTFIVPTSGRATLNNTLASLKRQTDKSWKAIVISDGIQLPREIIEQNDDRFSFIFASKLGSNNYAGELRNIAIEQSTAPWIGFVDDDDQLDFAYVHALRNEVLLDSSVDLVVFRMIWPDGRVIPTHGSLDIRAADVGISFAMKKELFDTGYRFEADEMEDFNLISNIQKAGYKVLLTQHLLYYVTGGSHANR